MGKKSSKLADQLKARKSALKKTDKPDAKTGETKDTKAERSSSTTSTVASPSEKHQELKRARDKSAPVFVYRTPTKPTPAVNSPPVPDSKAQEVEREKKGAKVAIKEKEKEKEKAKKVDHVEKEKNHEKKVEKKGEKKVEKKVDKKGEKQKEEDAFDSMLEGIVGGDSDSEKSHCSESTLELGKQSEEEEGGGCDEESESEENEDEQESSEMEEEDSAAESSEEEAEAEEVTTKKRRKEEKAPKTEETAEDKKGDKGEAIVEAANRAAEGAARANSVSHKREWDTFSRQCNDRKKFPVGLADYVNTRKTDLFQLWLENNQNLHESKPQLFSKPCWNPCITPNKTLKKRFLYC